MSVRLVQKVGETFNAVSTNISTITVTVSVPVGRFLILGSRSGNGIVLTSISDSSGNTWVKLNNTPAVLNVCSVWYCTVTNALTTSSTITCTFSGATSNNNIAVWAFDGITRPTTTNQIANNTTTTSISVASVSPSQYGSLMFSVGVSNIVPNTFSVSSGWTLLPITTSSIFLCAAYAIPNSMASLATTWTFGSSGNNAAVSGTFTPNGGDFLALF